MHPDNQTHPVSARVLGALLALAAGLLAQAPLHAAASFPPGPEAGSDKRWDSTSSLKPGTILGDSTFYEGNKDPKNGDTLMWHGLDIETDGTGTYMFTATGQGLQVIRLNNPGAPEILSYIYGWITGGAFPSWNYSDKDWYIKHVDAPDGFTNLVALTMEEQGFAIVRTDVKNAPIVAYQRLVDTSKVHAFTGGTTHYAYASNYANGKVYLFNLSAAAQMNRCLETPPVASCGGVYMGEVTALGSVSSLDGNGKFVITSKIGVNGNLKIWDATLPNAPSLLLEIGGSTKTAAMWKIGSSYYAAKLDLAGRQLTIYDVSCIAGGACTGAPQVYSGQVSDVSALNYITASTDGGKSYLYLGADDLGSCVAQREYIYDVTTPSAPSELTPKIHVSGYWGWYYMGCPTGFNLVGPRIGKVYGNYLFRAALTLLDSHQLSVAGPPTANFTWSPAEVYPGTPVQFTDQSSGIPTSWAWAFQDGTPAAFGSQAPPTVTFASVGAKTISLDVSNGQGPGPSSVQTVTVLNPAPQVASVGVSPANPVVCQPITFTATGAAGQPVLSFAWDVKDSGLATHHTGTVNPDTWDTALSGPLPPPGTYTATVTVNNTGGPPATASATFTLAGLAALPGDEQFTPVCTNCVAGAPPAGVAQLSVSVPGATEWSWDCGSGFGPFSSDPVAGPVHSCSYTTTGAKTVKVKVKNCVESEKVSAGLGVTINQVTPLKALFAFNGLCSGGICFATAGQALAFIDLSTGAELWDYDWNGDGTFEDADNATAKDSHTYPAQGTFTPKLRVRRGATEQDVYTMTSSIVVAPATPGNITVSGPTTGQPNAALSFSASASGSCNPSPTGWSWTSAGGTITNGTTSNVTISYSATGVKTITVTNSACSGVSGAKSVTISTPGPDPGPGTLKADFTFTPAAPAVAQAVSFNGTSSTGSPTAYVWDFGDGTAYGEGAQVTHTFGQTGTYLVQLNVTKPGNCPPAPFCSASITKTVVVGTGEPPLGAAFETSAVCISEFGLNSCAAEVGKEVTFTDKSTGGPTSWSWAFGDGDTATGANVAHTFQKPGAFTVLLTVTKGSNTSTSSKSFNVTGEAKPKTKSLVLPWIAKSSGVLVQSSDLYVHNPGTMAMDVDIEFRRRGLPEVNPPKASRTIQPGATLYVPDVLQDLFNRENISGFVAVTKKTGDADPVLTSFNTTFASNGSQFGQTIPGIALSEGVSGVTLGKQYLVGLNDNGEREAYFGVTNPSNGPAAYRLKFFDSLGRPVGTPSGDLTLSSFGFKQFQPAEIRSKFGLSNVDDYRVEVETVSGNQLYPFGANVRVASDDPSYLGVGTTTQARLYLVGAMSTPGINKTSWQTDLVLANVGTQVALADVSFLKAGLTSQPTAPLHLTLQPGESRRLENVVGAQWNILDSVGVVIIDSDSPNSVFPIVQGESYETTNPDAAKQFGQFMSAFSDEDAAGVGQAQYLVGLRQDAKSRTTYWIYNPSNQPGSYDLIYRALDGTELGRISAAGLGAGKFRQISPSQHPLPATGASGGGFTLEVLVRSGKALTAAQVINNQTNDPAYMKGQTQ